MDYIEEITRIARENIDKADNAGYGMYNFPILIDKIPINGVFYKEDILLQTYPYKETDYYGLVYLLYYYPLDDTGINWDHEDFNFKDLSKVEQEYIFNEFKKQIAGEKPMETKVKLIDFVKKDITFEEKVKLIEAWEEDRGADGEFVYDLDNDCDAKNWIELYGADVLYKCREIGRYWLGGWQFGCMGKNTEGNVCTAWCINEESMKKYFTENNLLYCIEDEYEKYMESVGKDKPTINDAKDFGCSYYGLIDFEGYFKATHNETYKWVGVSDDHSFECASSLEFKTMVDAYDDMRQFALEKMKWNTEYDDIDGSVFYNVRFCRDKIIHKSYSGKYLFKIVPSSTKTDSEFFKDLQEEAKDAL